MEPIQGTPIEELIAACLDSSFEAEEEAGDPKSHASWDAICKLGERGDSEVLEAAKRLLTSIDPWHRSRGASILGKFGQGSMVDERYALLTGTLASEKDERVIAAVIHAMSHLHDPRILSYVLAFEQHPYEEARWAVVMAMEPNWGSDAVSALLRLSSDPSASIRDWATFKFRISDVDSSEIREALRARLSDADLQTKGEAICALARRQDIACLEELIYHLGNLDAWDCDYACLMEAADRLLGYDPEDEHSPEEVRNQLIRRFR
jgi:HEAT repeat protein